MFNFVPGHKLIMRNLTAHKVERFTVDTVEFAGEVVTFNKVPIFNLYPAPGNVRFEYTEVFTEPGTGTDLSMFVPGLQIEITGSLENDGIYDIKTVTYGKDRWVQEDPFGQRAAPEGTLAYTLEGNNTTTWIEVSNSF